MNTHNDDEIGSILVLGITLHTFLFGAYYSEGAYLTQVVYVNSTITKYKIF